MSKEGIPLMEPLAPIVDQLREIAREELPAPLACKIYLWDDGDSDIIFYHNHGSDEREQVVYDPETGAVRWQYRKGPSTESEFVSEEAGTCLVTTFEEREDRDITTINPPVE